MEITKEQSEKIKDRYEKRLEDLLLEGLESGESTPLIKSDFQKIKERGLRRIKKNESNNRTN